MAFIRTLAKCRPNIYGGFDHTHKCARRRHRTAIRGWAIKMETTVPLAAAENKTPSPFCSKCATKMEWRTPPGDERERNICPKCGTISYDNPKLVVGCVPVTPDGKRVLLTKRAIPPIGKWTVPAGFLEVDETADAGARREAWEEAYAIIDMIPLCLLAVYNILPAQQVQLMYRGTLLNEFDIRPGAESLEARLFEWEQIPWDELAFPTVSWALQFSLDNRDRQILAPQLKTR